MPQHKFDYLARYNAWINESLYGACAAIDDSERKRDRGAFFGSLHGTFNHILLADRVWMGRFENIAFLAPSLDTELYADFDELRAARKDEDERIIAWVDRLTDDNIAGDFTYTSMLNPARRRMKYAHAIIHFFNHQTHHRGQLTTLLAQMGIDYGVTDMIGMPDVLEVIDPS